MPITMSRPEASGLDEAVHAVRDWQRDGTPVPLHPGDIGWYWRFGAQATAAAVRAWRQGGRIVAVGLLDGPGLVRLAVTPDATDDEELAAVLAADIASPERGILAAGPAAVEARFGGPLRRLLADQGWEPGEPWTPLARDLAAPVAGGDLGADGGLAASDLAASGPEVGDPEVGGLRASGLAAGGLGAGGLRVEVIGADGARERAAVQRAAFDGSTFSAGRWQAMAAGPAYADARCLVGRDDEGAAVAAATAWSAGPGRPGLLEPAGVHRDHRRRGYGTAITLAAAAMLRELGASSAVVCTRAANTRAVATYQAAGFRLFPDVPDLCRTA
ncbi:MAG TPA: GNAT family N-acetyltransferase [Trebonia sp.]|nr:GNAT family N-acetyltransferase [Trebonia sp.]